MGTLASELGSIAAELTAAPRVYADAKLRWGAVAFMRQTLQWNVLFVIEHDDLRRASDREHFRRALDLGRTLVTMDRDFMDDRRFPLEDSPGVIVCSAPDDSNLLRLLAHVDETVMRADAAAALPLRGRKIQLTPDVFLAGA